MHFPGVFRFRHEIKEMILIQSPQIVTRFTTDVIVYVGIFYLGNPIGPARNYYPAFAASQDSDPGSG